MQELLKGDAESQASKILASQHFRKANQEQRVEAVKHILGKVRTAARTYTQQASSSLSLESIYSKAEHQILTIRLAFLMNQQGAKDTSGSQLIAKIAKVVADKHETYHQVLDFFTCLPNYSCLLKACALAKVYPAIVFFTLMHLQISVRCCIYISLSLTVYERQSRYTLTAIVSKQRMEAMRELLDSQTDSLKHKGLVHVSFCTNTFV